MMSLAPSLRPQAESLPLDFDAVYDSEFGFVWNSLKRLGILDVDLEDLTQEVFVRAYHSRDEYDPQRPLRPWLFGVAFRAASTFKRSAHQRREFAVPQEDFPR